MDNVNERIVGNDMRWEQEKRARALIRQGEGTIQIAKATGLRSIWIGLKMREMGYPVKN